MQQPQPSSSKGIAKATTSLAECIKGLLLELQRETMSYFLPRFSGRKKFPWSTAYSGSVMYDSFTTGLAPRILSRAIYGDLEEEVSKCLRNKPITMTMKIKREGPLHPTPRLLPHLCQPDDVLSVQRRRAIFCVKTWWGLLLAMLVDLAATRDNRVWAIAFAASLASTPKLAPRFCRM
ncbi:hypothetical protein J1614_011702 [Plenodomus biglobosus]|nr:hypothetical protein J1614_011702 [Plenodomus biglobosus]